MGKMLYREIDKDAVRAEYDAAADAPEDYAKAKWGSHESMLNRFALGHRVIDWPRVDTWLDVGCGTGAFFSLVESHGLRFSQLTGIDLSGKLIAQAAARKLASPVRFLESDAQGLGENSSFDLITMIGVLQQCGSPPDVFLPPILACLKPGGQFFMTTKNAGWREFKENGLIPEANHSWFDHGEIIRLLESLGAKTLETGGFIPNDDQVVAVEDSHTFFVLSTME